MQRSLFVIIIIIIIYYNITKMFVNNKLDETRLWRAVGVYELDV